MKDIDYTGWRFGPVWLNRDVSRIHLAAFLYASLVTIGLLTFVNVVQNYMLREVLLLKEGEFGEITGLLTVLAEITIICTVGLFGLLCDRIGRRPVYAFGLLLMGLSYVFYPLATTLAGLIACRVIYAGGVAAATGMLGTVTNDYPQEVSRGKMIAMSGILLAIGAILFNFIYGQLPVLFVEMGEDALSAGRDTAWLVAGMCLISAILVGIGLKPGAESEERHSFRELAKVGIREGAKPRTALAYMSAFVARSDLVIIGAFTTLWPVAVGEQLGYSTPESTLRGTQLFIAAQLGGLIWAPIMGLVIDRVNRVSAMSFGALVSALAFAMTAFVDNPFDNAYLPIFLFLGVGQISIFYASQALIGQEAPPAQRGTVIGVFATFGAIGILFFSGVGGALFDAIAPWAVFVFVGIGAFIIFLVSLWVRIKHPGPMPGDIKVRGGDSGNPAFAVRNVVITGSTRGIGRGLATEFLKRGHNVAIVGRSQEAVDETAGDLRREFPDRKVAGIACDVADYDQVRALWDAAKGELGDIDIWINNAGINNSRMPIAKLPFEELQKVPEVNLLGTMYGCKVALAGMNAQGHGAIYTFEGFGSNGMQSPGSSIYGSTKYAIRYFTNSLVNETKGGPVIVGTISPGIVLTDMILRDRDNLPPQAWESIRRVYAILADRVETVTPFLVEGVLANSRHGGRIMWLTPRKSAWRFLKARLGFKRKPFDELGAARPAPAE